MRKEFRVWYRNANRQKMFFTLQATSLYEVHEKINEAVCDLLSITPGAEQSHGRALREHGINTLGVSMA